MSLKTYLVEEEKGSFQGDLPKQLHAVMKAHVYEIARMIDSIDDVESVDVDDASLSRASGSFKGILIEVMYRSKRVYAVLSHSGYSVYLKTQANGPDGTAYKNVRTFEKALEKLA